MRLVISILVLCFLFKASASEKYNLEHILTDYPVNSNYEEFYLSHSSIVLVKEDSLNFDGYLMWNQKTKRLDECLPIADFQISEIMDVNEHGHMIGLVQQISNKEIEIPFFWDLKEKFCFISLSEHQELLNARINNIQKVILEIGNSLDISFDVPPELYFWDLENGLSPVLYPFPENAKKFLSRILIEFNNNDQALFFNLLEPSCFILSPQGIERMLNDPSFVPFSMNDLNDIAGVYWESKYENVSGCIKKGDGIEFLFSEDGAEIEFTNMNNKQEAIGSMRLLNDDDECEQSIPILWKENQGLVDLNDLLPEHAHCVLSQAHAINNAGQILASGHDQNGKTIFVLLTPCN